MSLQTAKNLGYGGRGITDGYLEDTISELQSQNIAGPIAGVAANALLAITGIDVQDFIQKVLMNNAGVLTDITSTCSIAPLTATATLTVASAVAGGTFVVNGRTFTLVTFTPNPSSSLPPLQVAVGGTDAQTAANIAQAISAQCPGITATATTDVVTLVAGVEGTGGNAYTLVGSAHLTASGATFAGGTAASGIKSTTNTTGNQVLVFWYQAPRNSIASL